MLIHLTNGNQRLTLHTRGATIFGWDPGTGESALDGYQSVPEFDRLDGHRNCLLIPWTNRVAHQEWNDDGTMRGVRELSPEGLHGFAFDVEFTVAGLLEDRVNHSSDVHIEGDHIDLVATLEASEAFPGPIDVTVRYDISHEGVLRIGVSARNTSERDIPLGLGWHPYFKVASVRDARVWVPATHRIVVDDDGIPLPALRAFRPIKSDRKGDPLAATAANAVSKADGSEALAPPPAWLPESDVLHEINLHDELDTAFTGLHNDEDARAHAYLDTGLGYGVEIAMGVGRTDTAGQGSVRSGTGSAEQPNRAAVPCRSNFHIFTGPDLARDPGLAIALEPCTVMPDMLNREEEKGRVSISSGDTRTLDVVVAILH